MPADIAPSPITGMTCSCRGEIARHRHAERSEIEVEEWAAPNGS